MKVLLTGFDPFGGESVNPAFEAIKLLPSTIAGAEIVYVDDPTNSRKVHRQLKRQSKNITRI